MDKARFFASIRRELFPAGLDQQQVERIEVLLDAIAFARWPLAHAAYGLATAHHETAQWRYMRELGGADYFHRMYDRAGSRPHIARQLGNTEAGDGGRFFGRGYAQLTGRANYLKAGKALGLDLIGSPHLAEQPATAARILIWGMETGAYTGKRNADYLDKIVPDYVGARRIINGTDRAALIAGYAKDFEVALRQSGYGGPPLPAGVTAVESLPKAPGLALPPPNGAPAPAPVPPAGDIVLPTLPQPPSRVSLWDAFVGLIASLIKRRTP